MPRLRGGATFAACLPDSMLAGVERLLEPDADIRSVVCTREDDGIAIATGAALAGELPVVLIEGSGLGVLQPHPRQGVVPMYAAPAAVLTCCGVR